MFLAGQLLLGLNIWYGIKGVLEKSRQLKLKRYSEHKILSLDLAKKSEVYELLKEV